MTDKHEFWQLTNKYLSGEISESEKKILLIMQESDPSLREEFEAAIKMWQATAQTELYFDMALLQRTYQKIKDHEAGNLEVPELPAYDPETATPVYTLQNNRGSGWRKWIAAAAVLTGISLLSYWLYQNNQTSNSPVQWASIDVLPGKQHKIILADSSIVYVNAGSHIEYPLSFQDSVREIRLSGEAFFEVTRNTHQPFIVHSGDLHTRVLGTSFNVRAYKEEETQTVSVATGRVQVSTNEKPLDILQPDHLLTYKVNGKTAMVTNQSFETMNWRKNRMAFKDISFKDLAAELGRRYGKTLVFQNPVLKNCRYRVIFNDLPFHKILQQLSLTNGFSYKAAGDSIFLQGKGCE